MKALKVGLVGCGNICDIYFQNCRRWPVLDVVACADLIAERAEDKAKEYDIPKACSVDELMKDPDIDIVLNLTTPQSHAAIYLAALEAGKHAYSEKPQPTYRFFSFARSIIFFPSARVIASGFSL